MKKKCRLFLIRLVRPIYRKFDKTYDRELKRVEDEIRRLDKPGKVLNILESETAYDATYFSATQFGIESNYIPSICNAIYEVLHPKSLVDFGCGQGIFLKEFLDKGVRVLGFEGSNAGIRTSVIPRKYSKQQDLRRVMKPPSQKFDCAISFEVAEHIEREFSGVYLNNLTSYSDCIVFTAFPPDVIDKHPHHPNEQPIEYWFELFKFYGYSLDSSTTHKLQQKLHLINLPTRVRQYENMYVLRKRKK